MEDRSEARVVAVVQARMGSTRLPGKVLAEIGGEPALRLLLRRLGRSAGLAEVAVATSTEAADDPVATAAAEAGVPVVRGPLEDVLERYRMAAAELGCDAMARVTGDCPLIDPAAVDRVVSAWREGNADYASNILEPRSYPDGMDVEVLTRAALEAAAAEATDPADREHPTRFVVMRPERFSHAAVGMEPGYGHVRLSVDTASDLERVRSIVAAVGPDAGMEAILAAAARPL